MAITSSSDSASSLHSIDGLNTNEVKKLDELLKRVSVDMSKMTVGYTDGPTPPRNIDKLNSVIESGYRFLVHRHSREQANEQRIRSVCEQAEAQSVAYLLRQPYDHFTGGTLIYGMVGEFTHY